MNETAFSHFLAEGRTGNPVVTWRKGQAIRFDEFRQDVAAATGRLRSCRAGALLCQDSYAFSVGFFGLLHAGARVLLPHQNQPASLKVLEDEYDLLVDDAWLADLTGPAAPLSPLDMSADVIDVFTSGSTGLPQRITKNLGQFALEVALLEKIWGADMGGGTVYATVSHQHIYGLTFKILWPLAAGRAFAADTHMLWEDLVTALTPHAILISSPAHLSRLQGIPALPDETKLGAVFTAGAPLSVDAARQTESILGSAPNEIFGSTETGAIATRQPAKEKSWRTLPGIAIQIGEDQTLCLRSPFAGNEWISTKDKVEMVPGGFRFLGRADTIVKIEGKRVSLAAVEKNLTQLAEIDDAAVVMIPGSPDSLAAAIRLSEAGRLILERLGAFGLNRHLRQQLLKTEEAAAVPRLWRFVDALPTQPMGKRRAKDIMILFNEAS